MFDFLIANGECVYGKTIFKTKIQTALAEKHFILQVSVSQTQGELQQ